MSFDIWWTFRYVITANKRAIYAFSYVLDGTIEAICQ
jgi:hypothetical protein